MCVRKGQAPANETVQFVSRNADSVRPSGNCNHLEEEERVRAGGKAYRSVQGKGSAVSIVEKTRHWRKILRPVTEISPNGTRGAKRLTRLKLNKSKDISTTRSENRLCSCG
jgi:hypothetical protein